MNLFFPISVCCVSLTILLIGIFILLHDKKSIINRTIFFVDFVTFLWLYSYSMMYVSENYTKAMWFMRLGFAGVIFVPVFFYHFLSAFLEIRSKIRKILLNIFYLLSFIYTLLLYKTDYIASGLIKFSWGYYPKAGILLPAYLVYFLTVFNFCIYNLYAYYKANKTKISERRRQQIKYLFLAFLLTAFTAGDWIPWYGIKYLPLGFITILWYVVINAYAIVKHQLMGIEIIIRRAVVFAGLFAGVYGVIAFFTFLTQDVFQAITGGNRWFALIPSIMIITLALRPLENFLVRITDKYLFQKKYDYKELLRTFSDDVLSVMDLKKILNETINSIMDILRIESCGILVLNRDKNVYELAAAKGIKNKNIVFNNDSLLILFLRRTKIHILNDKDIQKMGGKGTIKEEMKRLDAELVLPLVLHESLIGAITLGRKKSGEPYTQDDLDILVPLSRSEAVAISNAQVMDDLAKTQAEAAQAEKMAVIGTLAAGINHEICNPLGIARGQCEVFLLNAREGLYKKRAKEEQMYEAMKIMEKVIKETDRATAITKKLSSFAKPGTGDINEDVDIAHEVDEVMTLVGHELELEKIEVIKDVPKDLSHIKADRKQIQEIFFNLVRNAGQAIEERGKIIVRAREKDGKIIVEIEDTGHGIPEDKLEQIFSPFYTTKAPGKGTGLGLFIVRQVIYRNRGTISVRSKVGVGTTFTLEFPVPEVAAK